MFLYITVARKQKCVNFCITNNDIETSHLIYVPWFEVVHLYKKYIQDTKIYSPHSFYWSFINVARFCSLETFCEEVFSYKSIIPFLILLSVLYLLNIFQFFNIFLVCTLFTECSSYTLVTLILIINFLTNLESNLFQWQKWLDRRLYNM